MKRVGLAVIIAAAVAALGASLGLAGQAEAQVYGGYGGYGGYGYPGMMGPGMMGPGMMGPGMMGPGMMGPGMMGPGMMGPGMMGPGMMGPGMMGPGMMGPGMMGQAWTGPGWTGQQANLNLSAKDVKANLDRWLAINGNPRLKVGAVTERDANTIVGDIVTTEKDVLVQRFMFDRKTGGYQLAQ